MSLVVDGVYWGAAAFLRRADRPRFTEADVRALSALADAIGRGLRRSVVTQPALGAPAPADPGPGVVVFDERGEPESISGAAQCWIGELVEDPPPQRPTVVYDLAYDISRRRMDIWAGWEQVSRAAEFAVQTR